jgi:phage terminase large subunit-like protein
VVDTAWNNLMLGLRLGQDPRCVVTTTPRPNALTRTLLARATTVVTRGSTYDNLSNLAPSFRDQVLATYEGTRIGRQELMGELLEDVEGALWTIAGIDEDRVELGQLPDLIRIVVGVDPSGGDGDGNDEQGIVVAGLGVDAELYVLADRSCKLSPHGWASRAAGAFHEFGADRVIAEINFGGQMVEHTMKSVDKAAPVKVISASRGKVQRAEPIAALYEQHKVHHVGAMPKLEDQMTTWTPADGTSPDRMDALVWALTELTGGGQGSAFLAAMKARAEAENLPVATSTRNWRDRIPNKQKTGVQ